MENEYAIDIIANGAFVDKGTFVQTIVFRANGAARNGWICSEPWLLRSNFQTLKDYDAYFEGCRQQRLEWEREIAGLLGAAQDPYSVSITQNVSEIYTAVFMTEIQNTADD